MSAWFGLDVVDGRPERRAAAAEHLRQVGATLRTQAETRGLPVEVRHVPPPEVPAIWVERTDSRIPTGARDLGRDARRLGWTVRYSYARGTDTGAKAWPVVDNVCVWLRRGPDWARMTYIDGRAWRAVTGGPERPMSSCTVTQLRTALGLPD